MSDSAYEVFRNPVPPSEYDVLNYKEVRLLGLKTNPEAFGSTFEGESKNTYEQWKTRIDNEGRATFMARLVSKDADDNVIQEEWVGTASILTPAYCGLPTHFVVGMWVHPEHRRKGVGKKLIELGIEWVRSRTKELADEDEARRLKLEVHRPNQGAKALYDGLGFLESKDEQCEDPNRIPMFLVVK